MFVSLRAGVGGVAIAYASAGDLIGAAGSGVNMASRTSKIASLIFGLNVFTFRGSSGGFVVSGGKGEANGGTCGSTTGF